MASNVLPFRRTSAKATVNPALDPGVPLFDPSDPAHIRAWNGIWALGRYEMGRGK